MKSVGIDDMEIHIPKLFYDIQDLAERRNIPYEKLENGLGLKNMAIMDAHEDAATMAANAVFKLIERNNLNPGEIGRIYMGTESSFDGAKPLASYVLGMLSQKYSAVYGADCFRNCDVVDLTFACIGAVDALQNTLDWVAAGEQRIGIVVSTDYAKYDLDSTGEYTQGAGAVALLVKKDPRLITITNTWGVATENVHDFFKPIRKISKRELIEEVLAKLGFEAPAIEDYILNLNGSLKIEGLLNGSERELNFFKDTPVFEGQYSNKCYQDRIEQAFYHFLDQQKSHFEGLSAHDLINQWKSLVFHLPYAFHGKRIFSKIFAKAVNENGTLAQVLGSSNLDDEGKLSVKTLKQVRKSEAYQQLVSEKIEKGQRASSLMGNLYTGSIFLSLMSLLEAELEESTKLAGEKLGFFAYGSGSKSKVFEGIIQKDWKAVVARFNLSSRLSDRKKIDYHSYLSLHGENAEQSILTPSSEFARIPGIPDIDLPGVRKYQWFEAKLKSEMVYSA